MTYVIRVWRNEGAVISQPGTHDIGGKFVRRYQPEAYGGRGDVEFTTKLKYARKFATMDDAMRFTLQQPKNKPLREDGQPNRPLRAFTLSFEPLDAMLDAEEQAAIDTP